MEDKDSSRTYLVVPNEMASYAERFGAVFDKQQKRFYVQGDVPAELINLLPKESRPRPHLVAPICPECGFHTVLITKTKSGAWFYGCSRWRSNGCKGIVGYEEHLMNQGLSNDASAISAFRKIQDPEIIAKSKDRLSAQYKQAFADVVRLGVDTLGSQDQFMKWISEPKIGLRGQTPAAAMKTINGIEDVRKLLLKFRK